MNIDVHHEAESDQNRHHGGAAVRNEGQRDADDRCQAGHHRDIDKDVKEEHRRDAHGHEAPRRLLRMAIANVGNHRCVEGDQQEAADQSELFCIHGKNKVRLYLGQEGEVALRPFQKALARYPARTERNERLQGVITGTQWITLGREEGHDPVFLIGMQHGPCNGDRRKTDETDQDKFPDAHPGEEEHGDAAHEQ